MPELPEVETIRRQLAPRIESRTIEDLKIFDSRWCSPTQPGVMARWLRGRRVEKVERRGKYLVLSLDGGECFLIMHLRMSGILLYAKRDKADTGHPHMRAWIDFDDGGRLTFVDQRRFGRAVFLRGRDSLESYFTKRLGPEPIDPSFRPQTLADIVRGRTQPIKALLMNQARVAGIGNIYADEALFRAGIHPLQPAGSLGRPEIERLHMALVVALRYGIDAGGASIDSFRDVEGASGVMQDRFMVHRRDGDTCLRCKTTIEKVKVAGRSTYVCPGCQKLVWRRRRKATRPGRGGGPRRVGRPDPGGRKGRGRGPSRVGKRK